MTNRVSYNITGRAALAALLSLWLSGCGSKEAQKPVSTPPTNQARVDDAGPILSAGDAAMLKAASQKPATEADRVWLEVAKALQAPPEPAEWQLKEPTKEEMAAFEKTNGVLAGLAADKAKDFYTRFPDHEKAPEARQQEYALLGVAIQMGNTNRLEQLRQLEEARLKDPNLSEDDRLELRMQQLQRASMIDKETNMLVTLAQLEKSARTLRKEFPKRPEIDGLLFSVAQGWLDQNEPQKSRALAKELADGASDADAKANAEDLIKKLDRLGKPLALKFKSIDGKAIDLQQLKGQVVLIDFWATWCGPCMAELPKVKAAYEKLHAKGFEILGISFDREKSDLEKVLAQQKMTWPQCFDDSEDGKKIGEEFGITGIPAMWLVDKDGVLRDLNAREGLSEKVEKWLAEKPSASPVGK